MPSSSYYNRLEILIYCDAAFRSIMLNGVSPYLLRQYRKLDLPGNAREVIRSCLEWNARRPLQDLPEPARTYFRNHARKLLGELQTQRLHIGLYPAPDPQHSNHRIYVVESQNPFWYSQLYHEEEGVTFCIKTKRHTRGRKTSRKVKHWVLSRHVLRSRIERAFDVLSAGRDTVYSGPEEARGTAFPYRYHWRLRDLIYRQLTEGKPLGGGDTELPSLPVCVCFGLEDRVRGLKRIIRA